MFDNSNQNQEISLKKKILKTSTNILITTFLHEVSFTFFVLGKVYFQNKNFLSGFLRLSLTVLLVLKLIKVHEEVPNLPMK